MKPSHDCGLFLSRSRSTRSSGSAGSSGSTGRRRDRKHAALTALFPHTRPAAPAESHAMDILWQYQFRIILLGDSTVGKSSLLKRFTDGIYSDVADPTVGVDFYARSLDIEPGVKIKLQLWDTAGQERFR